MKDKFERLKEFVCDHFIDFVIGALVSSFFWVLFGGLFSTPTNASEDLIIETTYTSFSRLENGIWSDYDYRTFNVHTYDDIYVSDTDFRRFDDVSTIYPNAKITFDFEGEWYRSNYIYNLDFWFEYDVDTIYLHNYDCTVNLYYRTSNGNYSLIYVGSSIDPHGSTYYSMNFSVPEDTYRIRVEVLYNTRDVFSRLDLSGDPRYQYGISVAEPTLSIVGEVPIIPETPDYSDLNTSLGGSVDDVLNELLDRAPTGTDSISLFVRTILSHHVILDTLTIVVCFGVVSFILYGKE